MKFPAKALEKAQRIGGDCRGWAGRVRFWAGDKEGVWLFEGPLKCLFIP